MKSKNSVCDVDLVYLWVDGNDPEWQKKRNAFIGRKDEDSSRNCKGRYANNDELKYSLRSVELYAPWIRKIFIVTDNQVPEWLDTTNPRIQIVDHSEILPPESRPCFNSCLIEAFLYRIPGLSEHFLYANDDMFLNREVWLNDFFSPDGYPIVRLTRKPFRKVRWLLREKLLRKPLRNFSRKIGNASRVVEEKYGIYYTGIMHHNIDSYLKSDFQRVIEEIFPEKFEPMLAHRMRDDSDIERIVFVYTALAEKKAILRYVTDRESMLVGIHKARHFIRLQHLHPTFFCLNDSEYATNDDRIRAKEYLQNRFPDKSSFEKQLCK